MDTAFLMDLDRDQLETLKKDIAKQMEKVEDARKLEFAAKVRELEAEYGLSVADLKAGGKGSKGLPKYANPDDASQTWTGRGRKPNWVIEALDNGKALEDLSI